MERWFVLCLLACLVLAEEPASLTAPETFSVLFDTSAGSFVIGRKYPA